MGLSDALFAKAMMGGVPGGSGGGGSSGGGEKWELINTTTVGADAPTSVTFSADANGNSFALKKFYLIAGTASGGSYFCTEINGLLWTEQFKTSSLSTNSVNKANPLRILWEIVGSGFYKMDSNIYTSGTEFRADGEKLAYGNAQSHIDSVTSVKFHWGTNTAFAEGDVFTLYGVRV